MKKPEFAKVFELAQIRCQYYPNCQEILNLSTIEKHEKFNCIHRPCKQCGRTLDDSKISMQAHIMLHCEETKMPCQFCKKTLTRNELMNDHKCNAIIPYAKFGI